MSNRLTSKFLGTRQKVYDLALKVVGFDHFKSETGIHTFVLSVSEWIEKTEAIGLFVKRGKYGKTYVHKDICLLIMEERAIIMMKKIMKNHHVSEKNPLTSLLLCVILV